MKNIEELFVTNRSSLKDAIARLNSTGKKILLLVDNEGKLLRTITDGDIRRLLIKDHSLNTTLSALPHKKARYINADVPPNDAIKLMDKFDIEHLPIVNADGKPISLVCRKDLTERILLSIPHLGKKEFQYVTEAFETNWIAPLGPNVDAFEKELANHVGIQHAAAISSGTAALHLALILLNVKAGDTVFCSSLTFVASANPILYQQATPVFIDSEPESWNMSPRALARAFADAAQRNKLPKAVIVVNLYGQSADMDALLAICNQYNVPIIEDAAESLGATYKNKASGTFGKLGIYSFNGNKIITTSGGGMLVSDDAKLIERARYLATQARQSTPYYQHTEIGYNYRMSNILAGIGRGQLHVLNDRVLARRKVFEQYKEGLKEIDCIEWMPETPHGRSIRWLSAFTVNRPIKDDHPNNLTTYLNQKNIEARHTWKPMHLQPLFKDCEYYPHDESCSVSETIFNQGICLPSSSNLPVTHQAKVINELKKYFSTIMCKLNAT